MPAIHYTISKIQHIIGASGKLITDTPITNLLTDSRKINNPGASVFFALSDRRDGHTFIPEVYKAGVHNFVVKHLPDDVAAYPKANFLVVSNVLKALQKLAAQHRKAFDLEIIGVTGSNGKTIVKEWLYQLLCPDKKIVRNPKSYNSQIGVALSVWQIEEQHNLGIFEAGISTTHEMEQLEHMIKPTVGVLTHIGTAHNEGFKDDAEKLTEKLKLFTHSNLLVYQYDDLAAYKGKVPGKRHFTWSRKFNQADLYVFSETVIAKKYYLRAKFKDTEIECLVPFVDEASIENAISCWATLLALDYDPVVIDDRMERLVPVSMRMELKQGINDCSIIDDSYNSDIQSLEIALNFLNQQNQHPKRTLILSDIFQSGLEQDVLYKQVANLVKEKKTDKIIGVGKAISEHRALFKTTESVFFDDTDTLLEQLSQLNFNNETILIKGSRSFEFERLSKALVQKAHETVLEINLNALQNNLNHYKAKLNPGVKLMAMVKAFSYGSGSFEVANMLQFNKVDYLAVAFIDEGVSLRDAGINLPIMVLNPEPSAYDKMVAFNLEPEIYSYKLLDDFIKFAQQKNIAAYPIHIKIDTGMRRLGFEEFEIEHLCDVLKDNKYVHVQSIFSHLAGSDADIHDTFTLLQLDLFTKIYRQIENSLSYTVIKHIANTSAITRWPVAQMDMVRLGIGLYGIDGAIKEEPSPLQTVASLKTSIAQIKHVKAGETIGYNRNGSLPEDGKIATVRIGYADGYLRAFGNGAGKMLVNGTLAPTVGNVSMDMCMIDITGAIGVKEGDEVVVFNEEYRIEELAKQIGTIPYEILTNVSQRVKRVYFYE
ncbi:bifunctional UDP-N-acetylmuramoyl-tripeptide:D-alanyl-D-alanine ligase/alanine racemase [Mucilaginibacter sp. HMF5004]|uniref:bifunctional UDP-N-acetylmuramoyl-tripeptide:D-alanyl-D-alanine ligase/alanine racemase n=1 Tax=Mucilaginibacter rivuli TaxID=2857527 RepID=UPI001C5D4902|nr:bifunctional UDP-N-acetylmuramoyl-tripeptide:D-alanyl-D-alanine ligase/alanine racemase [Mucilaginibacter rivuli]MBW4891570.1 bifunctional UDP-N-acetylmuramoyl-tripeptide:D-alanyl-D-alanine ligase/alanine racemase [Mucilaginibacter rivuli]